MDVWTAAGVRVTSDMEELVSVHLIPWWIAHIDQVHTALTGLLQTLGSEPDCPGLGLNDLTGDALLDQALEAVRACYTRWPNHEATDSWCLATVAGFSNFHNAFGEVLRQCAASLLP